MRYLADALLRAAAAVQLDAARLGLTGRRAELDALLLYDCLVTDAELRGCTRKLFTDGHHAKAVEQAFICLDNAVKRKSGIVNKTGYELMGAAFNFGQGQRPVLRVNRLRTLTEQSEQRGFASVIAGCMMAYRNPRAHEHEMQDEPYAAVVMMAWADHLLQRVRAAKRRRKR